MFLARITGHVVATQKDRSLNGQKLFVVEPLFLHRVMRDAPDPDRTFARMERMHRVALVLALITVAGAVAGSHGWTW